MQITKVPYAKLAVLFALSNISVQAFSLSSLFSSTPPPPPAAQNKVPEYTPKLTRCEVSGVAGTWSSRVCSFIKQAKKISEDVKNDIAASKDKRYNNVLVLEGPTGVGKTSLAKAIANNAYCHFFEIYGADVPNKFVGGSKDLINNQIATAIAEGKARKQPVIIFFDEIDVFKSNEKSSARAEYDSAYSALWRHIDKNEENREVFFIFATNNYDRLPVQLRDRLGSRVISISNPDAEQRRALLYHFSKMYAGKELTDYCSQDDIEKFVKETATFSARSIKDLCSDAHDCALGDDEPIAPKHVMYALGLVKVKVERQNAPTKEEREKQEALTRQKNQDTLNRLMIDGILRSRSGY